MLDYYVCIKEHSRRICFRYKLLCFIFQRQDLRAQIYTLQLFPLTTKARCEFKHIKHMQQVCVLI